LHDALLVAEIMLKVDHGLQIVGILIEGAVRYVNAFTRVELDTWSQPGLSLNPVTS